jgi:hypothetical protein
MNRSPEMDAAQTDTKPNGPVVAAFVAAGVASLVMGIGVVLNEASTTIKNAIGVDFNALLQFDKNYGLGSGVGPLSGKIGLAVIAYVVSWIVFFFWLRGKEVNFRSYFIAALVLVVLGFALTFPPIFVLFAPAG